LAASSPTLRETTRTIVEPPSGPAAGPTPVSPPVVYRVRLLCLELRICRFALSTHWNPPPLSRGSHFHLFQGRHPALRRGSFALDHGSCLLTLTLSFFAQTDDPVSQPCLPRIRNLLHRSGHHRFFGAFLAIRSFRDGRNSLFLHPVATPSGFDGSTVSFFAIGMSSTTLTHSNNCPVS
jgi:hypothetical protein